MSVSPDGRQVSDLEEMCLSVITANFGKYCIALKRSSDRSALRRNWESVARRFSETLFERLKSDMELTAEHLDFLINPYVKELDLVGIERTLPAVLIDKLKTYGKNILSLKARTSELENSLYKPLMASLPNVENMEFTTFWDPEILKPIGRNCPFLKVLLLEREDVLYGRTELDIKGKRKLRDGISFIMTQCPCLEVFDFSDTIGVLYKMHKSHLDFTRQKSSLRNFLRPKKSSTEIKKYALRTLASRKRNYPLCDALEICHIFCPNASSIDIDHVSCDEELEKISHFGLLEDVKLDAMHDVSPSCLSEFLTLRGCKLVRLEMSHVSCLSVLTLIESCPKLQSLKLRSLVCPDSSGEKEGLSLPDLKTLEYSHCSFRDPEISEALKLILSSAQRILSLSLTESSGLTNELVSSLDLNHIHELDVSSSDVAAKPLRYLLLHGKLQKLNVENCRQITYDDYFVLTACLPDGRRTVVDINWCFPDIHEQVYCVPAYQP